MQLVMTIDERNPYIRVLHAMANEETIKIVHPFQPETKIKSKSRQRRLSGPSVV